MFREVEREQGLDLAMTHRWSWITAAATGLMFKLQALQSVMSAIGLGSRKQSDGEKRNVVR